VEEDGLVFGRLGDAAAADVDTALGGQDDIDQIDSAEFIEDPTRFVTEAG
jgi:hypothetical protein